MKSIDKDLKVYYDYDNNPLINIHKGITLYLYYSYQDEDTIAYIPNSYLMYYVTKKDLRKRHLYAYDVSFISMELNLARDKVEIIDGSLLFKHATIDTKLLTTFLFDRSQSILYMFNKKSMYVIYNVDMISYNKIYIRRRQYEHGYC
jgi:hypothetical protein